MQPGVQEQLLTENELFISFLLLLARSLLKEYYLILLDKFPDDHVTTIGIMSEQVGIDDRFFNEILSTTNPREANERILNSIIIMLKYDEQIMEMCKLAKLLMRTGAFSKEILEFEIRTYMCTFYACLHIYLINHTSYENIYVTHITVYRLVYSLYIDLEL